MEDGPWLWPLFLRTLPQHGETFCYLKTDGREGFDAERWADRSELEDINEVLVPLGLGCVTGGGTGRTYSYVDLSLIDV